MESLAFVIILCIVYVGRGIYLDWKYSPEKLKKNEFSD